jgi:hypothetical protein
MRWMGYVARMGEMKIHTLIIVGKPERKATTLETYAWTGG